MTITAAVNQKYNESWQALFSFRLRFTFKTDAGILQYLNGKTFTMPDPAFVKKYFGEKEK